MKHLRITLVLSCALILIYACDNNSIANEDDGGGTASPLVGTWGTTTCLAPVFTSCDYSFTFAADGTYSNRSVSVKDPADGTGFDGCTITLVASGFTWTATDTTVTVAEGASPTGTVSRTGCNDAADDLAESPNPDFSAASYTFADMPWVVTGTQLTLGGEGGPVLTRR